MAEIYAETHAETVEREQHLPDQGHTVVTKWEQQFNLDLRFNSDSELTVLVSAFPCPWFHARLSTEDEQMP